MMVRSIDWINDMRDFVVLAFPYIADRLKNHPEFLTDCIYKSELTAIHTINTNLYAKQYPNDYYNHRVIRNKDKEWKNKSIQQIKHYFGTNGYAYKYILASFLHYENNRRGPEKNQW